MEALIIDFLKNKEQPGLKFNNTAIVVETKTKKISKKKSDQEKDALRVLEEYGIGDPQMVLREILEARQGEQVEHSKIKLKNLK